MQKEKPFGVFWVMRNVKTKNPVDCGFRLLFEDNIPPRIQDAANSRFEYINTVLYKRDEMT